MASRSEPGMAAKAFPHFPVQLLKYSRANRKGVCVMNGPIHNNPVSALLVGDYENDRLLVHNVFGRLGWRLFEAPNRRHALQCLHQHPVQVVMAESSIPQWNWKRVLRDLRNLTHPPQLIVTSR